MVCNLPFLCYLLISTGCKFSPPLATSNQQPNKNAPLRPVHLLNHKLCGVWYNLPTPTFLLPQTVRPVLQCDGCPLLWLATTANALFCWTDLFSVSLEGHSPSNKLCTHPRSCDSPTYPVPLASSTTICLTKNSTLQQGSAPQLRESRCFSPELSAPLSSLNS